MNVEDTYSADQMSEAVDLVVNGALNLTTAANLCGVPCKAVRTKLRKHDPIEERRLRRLQRPEMNRFLSMQMSEDFFKKGVKRVKKYIREKGHPVKLGEIYEAIALMHGYRNWATMKAIGFKDSSSAKTDTPEALNNESIMEDV